VPVTPSASTEEVARSLAEVGKQLSEVPVSVVAAATLDYGTAKALADLPRFVDRTKLLSSGPWPTVDLPAGSVQEVQGEFEPAPQESVVLSSSAKVIISIPPVVTEPLGLATTQKADLVVLCIDMGHTRLADVKRVVELVGRDRVAGCLLVH
jgi:hypothetical protein